MALHTGVSFRSLIYLSQKCVPVILDDGASAEPGPGRSAALESRPERESAQSLFLRSWVALSVGLHISLESQALALEPSGNVNAPSPLLEGVSTQVLKSANNPLFGS